MARRPNDPEDMIFDRANCPEHSGMKTWITVGIGLLATLNTLIGWQTFVQFPALRTDTAAILSKLDYRISSLEMKIDNIRQQRNSDHSAKEPLR